MQRAKIVCTLGPASDDRGTIRRLADAGMSVARLNASHGTTDERAELLSRVQAADEATADPLAAMIDLRGPEVRTATIAEPIRLPTGSTVRFIKGETATSETVGLSHSIAAVEPGDTVLLDDGRIETTVERVDGETVIARVDSGGAVGSREGVTPRGVDLGLDLIDDEDREDLRLAAEHGADFVAASFVGDAADVYEVVDTLESFGGTETAVVAKIERGRAIENLDGIIDAADGVMVARGDLGVECPLEDVPLIQKRIIRRCVDAGIPVITATEMLDSMVSARRPTRAEASDVANAVFDGTDAVMLSAETAAGDYPVEAVETMARIVRRIEASGEYAATRDERVPAAKAGARTEALARSARYLARDIDATAIVVVSESGYTARRTAKFRPPVPVVAVTPDDRVRRQLAVAWGIDARYASYSTDIDAILETAVAKATAAGVAESGDTIVVLSGMIAGVAGTDATNTLKVHTVAERLATGRGVVSGRSAGPLVRTDDGDLSGVQSGAIVALPAGFDGEFDGDVTNIGGIVAVDEGLTGYPAIIARELDVPMVSGATVPAAVEEGADITVDGDRAVVYEGDVVSRRTNGTETSVRDR